MNLRIIGLAEGDANLARSADVIVRAGIGLDAAANYLRQAFPEYFVYRGGSHIAVHPESGNPKRLLLLAEVGS